MSCRHNWNIAKRIGKCLEGDMHITRSRLAASCNMSHTSCCAYLRHLEMLGLVRTEGKRVRITRRGGIILCGREGDAAWDKQIPKLVPPPDVTARPTGPLTRVDVGRAVVEDWHGPAPMVTNSAPDAFPIGITIVAWAAMDGSGGAALAFQTVTVADAAR